MKYAHYDMYRVHTLPRNELEKTNKALTNNYITYTGDHEIEDFKDDHEHRDEVCITKLNIFLYRMQIVHFG